jgi:hypothetical protein
MRCLGVKRCTLHVQSKQLQVSGILQISRINLVSLHWERR